MHRAIVFPTIQLMFLLLLISSYMNNHAAGLPGVDPSIPEIPHIKSLKMNMLQPQENNPAIIWYDNFNHEKTYMESSGGIDYTESFGTDGCSMKAGFKKEEVNGEGNRKLVFGDFPDGSTVVQKGNHYDEVYWRIYVMHEYGWEGTPAKMLRATSIVSEKWQQAMITHVWSGEGNSLTLDPASGIKGQTDSVITKGYNDFSNLRWLGNKPCSEFPISSGDGTSNLPG
jgi:hypothetical protein